MATKIHGQPSFHIHLERSNKLLLQSIFLTRTVRQLWIPSASFWWARRWNRNITEQIFPTTLGNNWQIRWLLQSTGIISLNFPRCYDKHCLHQTAVLDIATLWIPVNHTKKISHRICCAVSGKSYVVSQSKIGNGENHVMFSVDCKEMGNIMCDI